VIVICWWEAYPLFASRNLKENDMKIFLRMCLSIGLVIAPQIPCIAQTPAQFGLPAQYSATAFGQSGALSGKSFGLSVYVDRVSDDGEAQELAATLKSKGPDALVSVMENMKGKGRFSPTGSTGTEMPFVRIHPTKDGGQHIVLVTNRPISFPELYNGTRSRDYKFGIVTLDVDKDGKGTGTFAPLCKIKFNKKNELEIEHYGQKPFRLANVYKAK
jgi:hypothetical protein